MSMPRFPTADPIASLLSLGAPYQRRNLRGWQRPVLVLQIGCAFRHSHLETCALVCRIE